MMKPWDSQKIRQRLEDVPKPEDVIEIAKGINDKVIQVAFVLMYLTAGRSSEITKNTHIIEGKKVIQGLKKKDIELTEDDKGREILILTLPNRKHKKKHFKKIPIPISKEKPLLRIIKDYINNLQAEQYVIPISKIYLHRLLMKHTGINPHYIRHLRLSHLVVHEDFNEQLLVLFAGWTDSRPAKNYMELRWKDILQKY